jgi:hypothetical protein
LPAQDFTSPGSGYVRDLFRSKRIRHCRRFSMPTWFVPPIVVPAGLVVLLIVVVIVRQSFGL